WIVGFATLAVWAAGSIVEQRSIAVARRRLIEVSSALAATLVNPYGLGLWTFLHETVGLERDISDWTPFLKFPAALIAMELVLPTLACLALWRRRQLPPLRYAGVLAVLAFATVRVGRVDAFLQLAIGMLLAPALVSMLNDAERWLRAQSRLTNRS